MERMLRVNLCGSLIVGLEEDRWLAHALLSVSPRFASTAQELRARAMRIMHLDVRDHWGNRYEDFNMQRLQEF